MLNQVGRKIKMLRTSLGMTQQELADGIVTRSFISQLENGTGNPSFHTLEKLAERLQTNISFLFDSSKSEIISEREIREIDQLLQTCDTNIAQKKYQETEKLAKLIEQKMTVIDLYDEAFWGRLYRIKAVLQIQKNHWEEAKNSINKSVELLQFHEEELAKTYNTSGMIAYRFANHAQAQQAFLKAIHLTTNYPKNIRLRIETLTNMGIFHANLREYSSAVYYLSEALDISESTHSFYHVAEIQMSLGVCYRNLADFEKAEATYLKALTFISITEDDVLKAGVYVNLGILQRDKQNFEQALYYFDLGENIYRQKGKHTLLVNSLLERLETNIIFDALSAAEETIHSLKQYEQYFSLFQTCMLQILSLHLNYLRDVTPADSTLTELERAIENVAEQQKRKTLYKKLLQAYVAGADLTHLRRIILNKF